MLLDHDDRLAPYRGEPLAELLGVAHRGGECCHCNVLREVDDHLFPHSSTEAVGEVVDLVHHHITEALKCV